MASILGVETLQHTNGTTAATIASDGKVSGTLFVWPFPASATVDANDVKYQSGGVTSTDASHLNLRCPTALTVKSMYLKINGTPASGSTVVTVMKNSSATSTAVTTNTTDANYESTTETAFNAGDTIGIKIACSNTDPHWNHVTLLCEIG